MLADPSAQLRLLDVQQLDSRIDALRNQRAHIPELAELAEVGPRRKQTEDRIRDRRVQISDLTDEQRKADRDVEAVKSRRERDQAMLDSGKVANPRDAEAMMHEVESLERRISDLEDIELEVMERLEATQRDVDVTAAELDALTRRVEELERGRQAKESSIDAEIAEVLAERATVVAGVPADLIELYDKLRVQKGGLAAAALRAKQCEGCRLTLDAAILRDIAAAAQNQVLRCEECGRILVRTPESGL